MRNLIKDIKLSRDKITITKLESIGFKYDEEDNLYYNTINSFRIGYNTLYKKFQLFDGGYDKKFGFFISFTELKYTIYKHLESEKFKLQI